MQLSASVLDTIHHNQVDKPTVALLALPERVLQFGTGVLLRGLPDYFIDKANKQGIFNGRVVVVKSTNTGGTDQFRQQDGLYTLQERGFEQGRRTDKTIINAAISRVLSAATEWDTILDCATNPDMQVVISNTTEVGITLVAADATAEHPVSFPGKLLLFLLKRYETFKGSAESGMVIIPAELISDNGARLKAIITELARLKNTGDGFIDWLNRDNDFCNSLVDRIVPGKLGEAEAAALQQQLGYADELMIMSEPYRLWAIETKHERTRNILSFAKADAGVILAPDIHKFRELKLRLLNGTHTFSCGLAHLAGFTTVKEAMEDTLFAAFVSGLMLQEIAPLVADPNIPETETSAFALQVIDRFRNPYIEHQWLHITVQYTSKMAMRNVPLLQKHYTNSHVPPALMALGFAAYLLFARPVKEANGKYHGEYRGKSYPLQDDKTAVLYEKWNSGTTEEKVAGILGDMALWGADLSVYPGFADTVLHYLIGLVEQDAKEVLRTVMTQKKEIG